MYCIFDGPTYLRRKNLEISNTFSFSFSFPAGKRENETQTAGKFEKKERDMERAENNLRSESDAFANPRIQLA